MREIEVLEIGTFTSIPTSEGAYFVEGKDIVLELRLNGHVRKAILQSRIPNLERG